MGLCPYTPLRGCDRQHFLRLTRLALLEDICYILKFITLVISLSQDFSVIIVTQKNASQSSKLACGKKLLRCRLQLEGFGSSMVSSISGCRKMRPISVLLNTIGHVLQRIAHKKHWSIKVKLYNMLYHQMFHQP